MKYIIQVYYLNVDFNFSIRLLNKSKTIFIWCPNLYLIFFSLITFCCPSNNSFLTLFSFLSIHSISLSNIYRNAFISFQFLVDFLSWCTSKNALKYINFQQLQSILPSLCFLRTERERRSLVKCWLWLKNARYLGKPIFFLGKEIVLEKNWTAEWKLM